ncbi:hypothetical protein CR513_35372, partial [Mucuna pruriens]
MIYNPQEKKLNPRTINGYFIGYPEKSKWYILYSLTHRTRIVKSRNAKFLENYLIGGSDRFQDIVNEKITMRLNNLDQVIFPKLLKMIVQIKLLIRNNKIMLNNNQLNNIVKKSTINNYIVYIQELDYNIRAENDLETFSKAMSSKESNLWYNTMKDKMDYMTSNQVWNLVELPNRKTHKATLRGLRQNLLTRDLVKQKESTIQTFSPILKKDFFQVIMTLVAYFDFKLHQMDVKTTFLNVCKLNKSIYGLKQASYHWYLKFHEVITSFGFEENIMDNCIYLKVSESKICFLVLYVDDILLATNDKGSLYEVKQSLSKHFDMKNIRGHLIHRERSLGILGLSQKTYVNKVPEILAKYSTHCEG